VNAELEEKIGRLQRLMSAEKLAGVLINRQPNFAWLSCGGRNGIDQSRENGAGSILVTSAGKCFVLANNIEMPRLLEEELSESDFGVVQFAWQEEKARPALSVEKAIAIAGGSVGTEEEFENRIAACRYSLTPAEIERYRSVCSDAGDALGSLALAVEPGMSEIQVADGLRQELAERELDPVVTLVAADERIGKFRHPVPTEKLWNNSLLIVTCAKRNGLIANLSRMVCMGPVSGELERKTVATAAVHAALLSRTAAGVSGAELYAAASKAYEEQKFPDEIDLHHQGGAAGYRTRDWVAHPGSSDKVQQNQAFAWNPSITGTKIEDTCIVGDDGIETLTRSDHFPTIKTVIAGREFKSTGILSI
jgi:Xaa-Pro aminopeptidase